MLPPLTVDAAGGAEEEPVMLIHVVGENKVTYKSGAKGSEGFPAYDLCRRVANSHSDGAHYVAYGEDGIASQTDTIGTYTAPTAGTYRIEIRGGSGAGAVLDCEPDHSAQGGGGGHLICDVPLNKGDVVTYVVANGGCDMSNVQSYAQWGIDNSVSGIDGHIVVGADGRDTIVKVNGVDYMKAFGGDGGVRMCLRDWFYLNQWYAREFAESRHLTDSGINRRGWTTKTVCDDDKKRYVYDDPSLGGKGGSTWYASGKGIVKILAEDGYNGTANGTLCTTNFPHSYGYLGQSWMNLIKDPSNKQGPGSFWISINHEHQFNPGNSTCTESGYGSVTCKLCGGTMYGVTPPHGHNFKPLTTVVKCVNGQKYYAKGDNSPTNNVMVTWPNTPNYKYTLQCQYCKEYAEPIKATYKVRYNEGTGPQILQPDDKDFGKTYDPISSSSTGWTRPGYFIAYWEYRANGNRYNSGDPEYTPGTNNINGSYIDLPAKGEDIVDLWAVWKPIPYYLRIHENYEESGRAFVTYTLHYDEDFMLPPAIWKHDSIMFGYDFTPTVKISPKYKINDTLRNLTTVRDQVIDIYTIWDLKPKIKLSTNEIHYSALKASSSALNIDNGTVSRSDLEAALMGYASAYDYEWDCRYPGTKIQPGTHNGYTFRIASFEPAKMVDEASGGDVSTYYVTFEVVDDANQSSTATMTLFIGNIDVDILVH